MLRFVTLRYLRGRIFLQIKGIKCTGYQFNRSVILSNVATSSNATNEINLTKIFEFAKKQILEAGKIVQCGLNAEKEIHSKSEERVEEEEEEDGDEDAEEEVEQTNKRKPVKWDLVTNFDKEIEEFLICTLSKEYPDHKFIGEECTGRNIPKLTDEPTWLIDPIDGTTNFIHNCPTMCISLGLCVCKEPVIGIIYNPATAEFYSAIKGEGAFLNGTQICTSSVKRLGKALVIFEPGVIRMKTERTLQINRLVSFADWTQGSRSFGSAALSLAYVARGIIDCFQHDGISPWDVAAGTLLVQEAGGIILDPKGCEYNVMNPNILAASTKKLAKEAVKLLKEADSNNKQNDFKK